MQNYKAKYLLISDLKITVMRSDTALDDIEYNRYKLFGMTGHFLYGK